MDPSIYQSWIFVYFRVKDLCKMICGAVNRIFAYYRSLNCSQIIKKQRQECLTSDNNNSTITDLQQKNVAKTIMFDLLDLIRKLLSQIIIGVRIIRWFGLMDELRYLLFFLLVLTSPMWWGLHDNLALLDSTYGSPGAPPPQKKRLITNFHQITSIFYMLLEDNFGVKYISKCSWGLEAYKYKMCMSSVDPWFTDTDLWRPGDTFAVAGDRAI